jgi:hypothetical protein
MSRQCVAFALVALTGAVLALPAPVEAAGFRSGIRAPLMIQRNARAGVLRAPLPFIVPRSLARARLAIPPSPHGFATTTPLHPFARLTRRHHGIYRAGWVFPATFGSDGAGYIGTPYDPAEAIPVYGPGPAIDPADPADPAPARTGSPLAPRVTNAAEENRDACRAERVTVPAAGGEREITVVRC